MLKNARPLGGILSGLVLLLTTCTVQPVTNMPAASINSPEPSPSTQSIQTKLPASPSAFIPAQPTPGEVIGGGSVQDGPFVFDLRLFRDPSFNQHPQAALLYSDLNGIGAYLFWFYQAAEAIEPVQTYWGTLPHLDQLVGETFASIRTGSSAGRTGGILLPGGFFLAGQSNPGDPILVALKVNTPTREYGAVLSFTLVTGTNGFEAANISIGPLSSVALLMAKTITPPGMNALVSTEGFTGPDPGTWVMLMKPVREYFYYRKKAVIAGDVQVLWDRYPDLKKGVDIPRGINAEAFMVANYKTLKPFDGNIDPEGYDQIKVKMEGSTAEVLVHGTELYLFLDETGQFEDSGGEFKIILYLSSPDRQHWTVDKTIDISGP